MRFYMDTDTDTDMNMDMGSGIVVNYRCISLVISSHRRREGEQTRCGLAYIQYSVHPGINTDKETWNYTT